METIIHKADSRGYADFGWLKTHYTFSFANYYNPARINFGTLRVLNDDFIAGGEGFGKHPHNNMEIITIPIQGQLRHTDSMGHTMVIEPNEVQVMTAGTGITHAEFNNSTEIPVKLFQIWIFPEKQNITPRYDQKKFDPLESFNKWQCLVSPDKRNNSLTIHQKAWISRSKISTNKTLDYQLNLNNNGIYLFIIEGQINLNGITLNRRDGIGIWNTNSISVNALEESDVLLLEIPILLNK
jgi:redox-sensitive bicupin YhaK (pirin superfamily)